MRIHCSGGGVRGGVSGFGRVRHIPTRMAKTTKTDKPSADKGVEELNSYAFLVAMQNDIAMW